MPAPASSTMMLTARRIGAYLIDNLCIMSYASVLLLFVLFVIQPELDWADDVSALDALQQQLIGLTTLTLPVVLIFAWRNPARGRGRSASGCSACG